MTEAAILALLESQKNERGIANWQKLNHPLKSFGLGLTQLKKIAKQLGHDHEMALLLWESNNYDVRTLAILIDDPKKVTRAQVDAQVGEMTSWMFSYVYCSNLLPKVSFLQHLIEDWWQEPDHMRRRCAYLCLYQLAKNDKKLEDVFFVPYLLAIEENIQKEAPYVKDAMNSALLMIGTRSQALHKRALAIAQQIGKIEIDYGANSCEALDVVKHLTSDRVQKKLAK
ncbi:MAG: DNA alkylation repair protein [Bacteroidota bacterium]